MGDGRDYNLIGKRIEEARLLRGMNKVTLAKRIGKSPSTITRYERGEFGKISIGDIKNIADVLSVNPMWLEGKSNNMEVPKDVAVFATSAMYMNEKRHNKIIAMNLTDSELSMIEKYRFLDEHGKDMTDTVIEKEYNRCKEEAENTIELTDEQIERLKLEKYLKGSQELLVARKVKK